MWNWIKRKPKYQFQEGEHFMLIPDLEAVKAKEKNPWNISFLGRLVRVHELKLPAPGNFNVDITAEVLYGDPFTPDENQQFGTLCMELVQRNILAREQ